MGYLLLKVDNFFLVFLIDNFRVFFCFVKKLRKYCNNLGESLLGIFLFIIIVVGSCNFFNFFVKFNLLYELNIVNCNLLLIVVFKLYFNFLIVIYLVG